MSEEINYKGLLQQYCLGRYPSPPIYETSPAEIVTVEGKTQWMVQIKYAKQTFETPYAIAGTKKQAEQEAAKLLMAEIESKQNAFLSGEDFPLDTDQSFPAAQVDDGSQEVAAPISVPSELVTTALQVASQQLLATSQPSRKRPLSTAITCEQRSPKLRPRCRPIDHPNCTVRGRSFLRIGKG